MMTDVLCFLVIVFGSAFMIWITTMDNRGGTSNHRYTSREELDKAFMEDRIHMADKARREAEVAYWRNRK